MINLLNLILLLNFFIYLFILIQCAGHYNNNGAEGLDKAYMR